MIFYFWPDKFGILSVSLPLSLSCCVWPCGRLISINVETNLKCENRKPKTENRIRMGAQQIKIKIKIKVCRGVSRTGNCELGTFLTHIIWWFYDFTTHIVALYDISSGRLTTFLVGTVGIALGYLRAEFGEQTGSVSGRFPRQPLAPLPSPYLCSSSSSLQSGCATYFRETGYLGNLLQHPPTKLPPSTPSSQLILCLSPSVRCNSIDNRIGGSMNE